jgi:hypothetical protein
MDNTKKQGLAGRVLRDIALPIILKKAARPGEMGKMAWLFAHRIDRTGHSLTYTPSPSTGEAGPGAAITSKASHCGLRQDVPRQVTVVALAAGDPM